MIRVLIVDDSFTVRALLNHQIGQQADMQVVGMAEDGEKAIRMAEELCPDVITMDFEMPHMDGLEATRAIMSRCARPIVLVSRHMDQNNQKQVFEVLRAGAVAVVNKPAGYGHPDFEASVDYLLKTLRTMSEVKVVTRRHTPSFKRMPALSMQDAERVPTGRSGSRALRYVAIGSSTGGPAALQELLKEVEPPFPLPILVVQHIAPGFLDGFVQWLKCSTGHAVEIGAHGVKPSAGTVYIAPDKRHMGIDRNGRLILSDAPQEHCVRPSVSFLFRALAEHFASGTLGVMLTGMGRDGAQELKQLRDGGAETVIQSEESCVVYGMPGEAQRLGAADRSLAPVQIGHWLNEHFQNSTTTCGVE